MEKYFIFVLIYISIVSTYVLLGYLYILFEKCLAIYSHIFYLVIYLLIIEC